MTGYSFVSDLDHGGLQYWLKRASLDDLRRARSEESSKHPWEANWNIVREVDLELMRRRERSDRPTAPKADVGGEA